MGGRVAGKTKKKSIKANVTSKFGSKRKTSRMGKKVKKGEMGPNTEFITRSAALKRLQITLKDFRRLCILKGIYPRVPTKAPKGSDKVYYDIKDISYVMHEPLLNKFREFKSFMKKIRRASGRNQFDEARRKDELKPVFTLDHLVKERYPRFIDALRDLDDALCMIHLFAALPSEGRITPERTNICNELARHWQYYISKSRTLHKVFVSVKGVYYQAEVMGEPINWLVPHQFTQSLPKEVDIRVMLTFLEFYEVFVRFVLFKLYHMAGMQYPPTTDQRLSGEGCFLLSIKANSIVEKDESEGATGDANEGADASADAGAKKDGKVARITPTPQTQASQARIATLPKLLQSLDPSAEEEEDEDDAEMGAALTGPLNAAFSGMQEGGNDGEDFEEEELHTFAISSDDPRTRLFSKCVFFINREVPLDWLQLCTVSFGGKVGWEGPLSPFTVEDPRITHQVVDRPLSKDKMKSTREYVQPQWVFDSINAQLLLPVAHYTVGAKLPPHLSPFVDDEKEGYLPKYREEIRKLQAQAGQVVPASSSSRKAKSGEESEGEEVVNEADEEQLYEKKINNNNNKNSKKNGKSNKRKNDSEDEESEADEEEDEEEVPAAKKSKVAAAADSKKGPKAIVHAPKTAAVHEDVEASDLSKIMMSKKTKRLYGRMQHGIEKKQEAVETLEAKRKLSEDQASGKASAGSKKGAAEGAAKKRKA